MKLPVLWWTIIVWVPVATWPTDATAHQSSRQATGTPQVLEQTAFTKTLTWPGRSPEPGDYRLHTTNYDTKSPATQFSKVRFMVEIVDGPGDGDGHPISDWLKIGGPPSGWVTWREAKDDVMNSSPVVALASLRKEAQTVLSSVQLAYVLIYSPDKPVDVEWSNHLAGGPWIIQATTNYNNDDFAYTVRHDTWTTNHPSMQISNPKAAAVAAIILARALVELINRKLYETTTAPTLLDALYIKVALRFARGIGSEALTLSSLYPHTSIPSNLEVEIALHIFGIYGAGPKVSGRSGDSWLTAREYDTVLRNKEQGPCNRAQETISTS